MMGGEIIVDSEFGKGSSFTIRLPADLASSRQTRESNGCFPEALTLSSM